jgi:hypothetical protein
MPPYAGNRIDPALMSSTIGQYDCAFFALANSINRQNIGRRVKENTVVPQVFAARKISIPGIPGGICDLFRLKPQVGVNL